MWEAAVELVAGLLGEPIADTISDRRERRKAARRREDFAAGAEVTIYGRLRRPANSIDWVPGELRLSTVAVYWKPDSKRTPPLDIEPSEAYRFAKPPAGYYDIEGSTLFRLDNDGERLLLAVEPEDGDMVATALGLDLVGASDDADSAAPPA